MSKKKTTYHLNGTVSYWSVYQQRRVRNAVFVPALELAAMTQGERVSVCQHIGQGDGCSFGLVGEGRLPEGSEEALLYQRAYATKEEAVAAAEKIGKGLSTLRVVRCPSPVAARHARLDDDYPVVWSRPG